MSTFFEKLTGGRSQTGRKAGPDDAAASQKEEDRKERPVEVVGAKEEAKTRHLKVEAEAGLPESPAETKEEEEEGELAVDICEKDGSFIIQSTVAGVKPEDLDVSITNDSVTIRGKREKQETVEEKNYYYRELFWGGFSRSVILPEEIEDDLAEATLKNGLLTIKLPKKKRGVVQKLKVRVS